MKNITDTLTPLMDKFRAKTGLTDKLTVARATSLMNAFNIKNLITDDQNSWVSISQSWAKTFAGIAVNKGDRLTFTAEVKDMSDKVSLALVFYDDQGHMLEPGHEGNAPIYNGNIADIYVLGGYSSVASKLEVTVDVTADNYCFVEPRIVSWNLGNFAYRNPIAFKQNQVGGDS